MLCKQVENYTGTSSKDCKIMQTIASNNVCCNFNMSYIYNCMLELHTTEHKYALQVSKDILGHIRKVSFK